MKNSTFLSLCIILISFLSCSKNDDYEKIDAFLRTELSFNELDDYDCLVVLNELGDCINCNKKFAQEMSKFYKNGKILYLISSYGQRIDISPFLDSITDNIVYDYRQKFDDLGLIKYSAIIELNNKTVTKITEISLKNINSEINRFNENYTLNQSRPKR